MSLAPKGSKAGRVPSAQLGNIDWQPREGLFQKRVKPQKLVKGASKPKVRLRYSSSTLSENRRLTRLSAEAQKHIDRLNRAESLSPKGREALKKFILMRDTLEAGIVRPPKKPSK